MEIFEMTAGAGAGEGTGSGGGTLSGGGFDMGGILKSLFGGQQGADDAASEKTRLKIEQQILKLQEMAMQHAQEVASQRIFFQNMFKAREGKM